MTTPPAVALDPLTAADFSTVRRLADEIWREHYAGIVGSAQIDFMLSRRCADEALAAYLGAADRWFDVLRVEGEPAGYCSHALEPADGVLKLEQLYLRARLRGRGLGRRMLARVERHALELRRRTVELQVNKRNTSAIGFYVAGGFTIREAAVFDIGGGHVMDDYVMVKTLG